MPKFLGAALVAALALVSVRAKADLIYDLSFTVANEPSGNIAGGALYSEQGTAILDLSDAALAAGAATFTANSTSQPLNGPPTVTYTSPGGTFVSLTGLSGLSAPLTLAPSTYVMDSVNLTLAPDGDIASGSILVSDDFREFNLFFNNGVLSGNYSLGDPSSTPAPFEPCHVFIYPSCTVNGTYTKVPEPSSFAMLLPAVFGIGWLGVRRRDV